MTTPPPPDEKPAGMRYTRDKALLRTCILNLKAALTIAVDALECLHRNKISDDIAGEALKKIETIMDMGLLNSALSNDNDAIAHACAVPEGWQLVPKEPTERMMKSASFIHSESPMVDYRAAYKAMLRASPPPPIKGGG